MIPGIVAGQASAYSPSPGGDPYWANVASLLHFDGTSGSTNFFDQKGKVWTAFGNAHLSDSQARFGGASGAFDGTGDYLSTPNSSDFDITSDFTIEAFVYLTNATAITRYIASKLSVSYSSGFVLGVNASRAPFFVAVGPNDEVGNRALSPDPIQLNTWVHVAGVKSGSTVRIFVDGILKHSQTLVASVSNNSGPLLIGRDNLNTSRDWAGFIDEFRITRGVARYASSFTPPSSAFPDY